jgi:uncharacterized BrkB/YihY/UPF0761 family membrane protein
MRFWNDWTDRHWDTVALALAFTTALAFAIALAVAFNALVTRVGEPWTPPSAAVVEDARGPLDPARL